MRLESKRALITGAARGIGLAIARTFCREGAVVRIADIDREQGAAAVADLERQGCRAVFAELDVADEAAWRRVIAKMVSDAGGVDVLVNNAGINIRKSIEAMSPAELDRMYEVNIKGPFLGIKQVLPVMKAGGGGAIINMNSVCGLIGHRYTPEAYTTAKGALTTLTKAIAARYGAFNIRCNSINPSTAATDMVRAMLEDEQWRQQRLGEVPLGRLAGLDDIAAAALYLASDEAAFVNGIALPVDGGVTAC